MILTLTAIGAVVAALLEQSLWPYVVVGGAHPHIVLVYVVIVAAVLGLDAGLAAAFVGGISLDLIAARPLGSSAFALLICAGLAVGIARTLVQLKHVAPIVAVFLLSFVFSLMVAILLAALAGPLALRDPVQVLLPGAIYDAVLAAVVGPLAVAFRVRHLEQERVDW
ncbi:MAG TPA: rod shape-determining protein MreD [Candidatus Dormibacteraeota bacterium]|nr:rod shape-determining protein MreD [Candidatus Dormibacteraeota bacterium]